jgi:hypothetical protein
LGELNQGTGPLLGFLKNYDEELLKNIRNTKTTNEAFLLLTERFGNITDATEQAALGNAAFLC